MYTPSVQSIVSFAPIGCRWAHLLLPLTLAGRRGHGCAAWDTWTLSGHALLRHTRPSLVVAVTSVPADDECTPSPAIGLHRQQQCATRHEWNASTKFVLLPLELIIAAVSFSPDLLRVALSSAPRMLVGTGFGMNVAFICIVVVCKCH